MSNPTTTKRPTEDKVQLLDLFDSSATFDNFIVCGNQHVVNALKSHSHQFVHISASVSSGKTHLLNAWVNLAKESGGCAIIFNAKDIPSNLLDYQYIACDDIDQSSLETQENLFDIFNYIKINHSNHKLLTSSAVNVNKLNIRDDLKTRILSGVNLLLHSPTDEELIDGLLYFCNHNGISINILEIQYLIKYYTRSMGWLINALKTLDAAAMKYKKLITINFIKEILQT